jgi:spore coat protein A, manganese oxidase
LGLAKRFLHLSAYFKVELSFEASKLSKSKLLTIFTFLFSALMLLSVLPVGTSQSPQLLDPKSIPKFVNQLTTPPPVYTPHNITDSNDKVTRQEYTIKVSQFIQQILPTGLPATTVWGYEGEAHDAVTGQSLGNVASTPGCTFEAIQGVPVQVKWVNNLLDGNGKPLSYMVPVDPTIHWANPNGLAMTASTPSYPPGNLEAQASVAIVTHLHGGEVQSGSDGHPEAWWTADGKHGSKYNTATATDANAAVDIYPNGQQPTTLWYHDHALGLTRLNVLSGLAGFYLIRNPNDATAKFLPSGEYEVPLAIQDRSFYTDGSLYYPTVGNTPEHPYWQPTFLGNTIVVNGEAWPNMNVKQGQYRLRILDGSNSRFYQLSFSNGLSFTQIGSDGGYLKNAVSQNSKLIGPGERIDILVDFSGVAAGQKIILQNNLESGQNRETTGQIMQFTVVGEKGYSAQQLPSNLNPTLSGDYPTLPSPDAKRILTLTDFSDPSGSHSMLLDGQTWDAAVSENPKIGSTEDWTIVNTLMDAHTIHLHLVQFQVVSRQRIDIGSYLNQWQLLNGLPPFKNATKNVPSLDPFLAGIKNVPSKNEQGWKDTVMVSSGEVVTIRVRWAEQNGNPYPFDASVGPGYVWHCHILEHEDNEMMRPYTVVSTAMGLFGLNTVTIGVIVVVAIAVIATALLYFKRFRHSSH